MRLELEVEDDQVGFYMELIGYFDFVKVDESEVEQEKIPKSTQIGKNQINQAMRGEIKLQRAQDFLEELKGDDP